MWCTLEMPDHLYPFVGLVQGLGSRSHIRPQLFLDHIEVIYNCHQLAT